MSKYSPLGCNRRFLHRKDRDDRKEEQTPSVLLQKSSFHLASICAARPLARHPLSGFLLFLLCSAIPINSQLIAEWHFSSSGTYTAVEASGTTLPLAAAGEGRNDGGGRGTSDSLAAAAAFALSRLHRRSPPPPPSIESKKLLRYRSATKLECTKV